MHSQMNDYFKFFSRIAVGLLQRQDSETLIQKLINEAVELIGADFGYIHLVDEKEQHLKILAVSNTDLDETRKFRIKKGEGAAGVCWELGESVVIDDYAKWSGRVEDGSLVVMKSAIAAPMMRKGAVFGVLGLGAHATHQFGPQDSDALNHFADVAAVAFENASIIEQLSTELTRGAALTKEVRTSAQRYRNLYRETEQRLVQSQMLVRVSAMISSDASLDEIAAHVQEADSASESDSLETTSSIGHLVELDGLPAVVFFVRDGHSPWGAIVASMRRPQDRVNREDREVLGAVANQFSTAVRQRTLLAQTQHQALHDELTGLANRRKFKQQVRDALVRAETHKETTFSLLIFDLDTFKQINDRHGHKYGDIVLSTVSSRLAADAPSNATVARLGGDEFAILLGNNRQSGQDVETAENLLRAIQQPISISGHTLQVGASVGISRYPEHGSEYSELMVAADAAMYSVKAAHNGGLKVYTSKRRQTTNDTAQSTAVNQQQR